MQLLALGEKDLAESSAAQFTHNQVAAVQHDSGLDDVRDWLEVY
jgi:hypothetical protein